MQTNQNQPAHDLEKSDEEDFVCPICFEQFDNLDRVPMMEPQNQHNVCLSCLNTLKIQAQQENKTYTSCPVCKVNFGFNDYTKNRLLANLSEKRTKRRSQSSSNCSNL